MKNTVKVTFCGVIAALGVVIMFLSGIIPIASIALPALAGCMLIPVVAECGEKWGFAVFAVTAAVSFFISADKEAFLIYTLFFGYYPVLYGTLDRIKSKYLKYALKLVVFNIAAVSDVLIITFVFGIPFESIEILGDFAPWVLLILANAVFVVYDFALKGVIFTYFQRLHRTAQKILRRK